MDFVVFIVVFGVFGLGLVFAIQAFVGKEINPGGRAWAFPVDPNQPGVYHPPERHRVRLFLIGLGLMLLAVVFGIVVW
jgi:hypothetical protein